MHRQTARRTCAISESWMPRTGFARLARLALPAAATFALLACAPALAETTDELYAAAKAEKTVVIYSGGPVAPYEAFIKDFEQRFPGVTVSLTGGFSNVLNGRIEAQLRERKLDVDIAFFQTDRKSTRLNSSHI